MARALDKPDKQLYHLVTFIYSPPTTTTVELERWTNWGSNIEPNGSNFKAVPAMKIRFPANQGTLGGKPLILDVKHRAETAAFLDLVTAQPKKLGPVDVQIMEITKPTDLGDTGAQLVPYQGRLSDAYQDVKGKRGRYRLEVMSIKDRIEISMGLQCNETCKFRVFGPGCAIGDGFGGNDPVTGATAEGPQFGLERKFVVVDSIDGKKLTVTADPGLTGSKTFRNGYLEFQNLHVDIMQWSSGSPTEFFLRRQAPTEWIGKTLFAYPGCDYTIQACRTQWNNEIRNGSYGIGIPDYDPALENPQ